MKKFILIFVLIILFIFWGVNKYNSFKVIKTFQELNNPQASKILQEYLLKKTPNFNQIYTNFPLETSTHAVFFDLNDDGKDEVIGFTDGFYCTIGYSLFILKKENDTYKDISMVNFCPIGGVEILNSKINGFNTMKISARLSEACSSYIYIDKIIIFYDNNRFYVYKNLNIFNRLKIFINKSLKQK